MKHMVIPDTQAKPDVDTDHMTWAGNYAAEKRPEVIVHIGDHWDMESLSTYDRGTKGYEGRRYIKDIAAGNEAMDKFMAPIKAAQETDRRCKRKVWKPRMVFTVGNHEYRIERAANSDPMLDGLIGYHDFNLEEHGWEVVPFLDPIVIDGIAYCHYFTSGVMGRPCANPRLMIQKKMMSCTMGHVQDKDIAFARKADGTRVTGLFAGIYYQHDEEYLNTQTNGSWSGIWMKHEVNNGSYDEMPVSINFLKENYS